MQRNYGVVMAQTTLERHNRFMRLALDAARRALSLGEVPVGAVVVREDQVVAVEHNRTVANADVTAHAELLAVQSAMRSLGVARLDGCSIYVTLEPCAMCTGALVLARVEWLVFGAYDERAGAAVTQFGVANSDHLNHRIEVLGGIMMEESRELLQEFFRARRGEDGTMRANV